MKNIWLRIGLGAGAIFAFGMIIVSVVKVGRAKIEDLVHSDSDIRIPLMGVVPFNVADQRLGGIRRLTLLRDAPRHLTGVRVEVRLADSVTIDPLKDCAFLTVNDPQNLNERTRFSCLADSAGLGDFGTIEVRHQQGDNETILVRTLLLTPEQIKGLQDDMGPRVTPDVAELERLRRMGDSLEGMGDSIRAATMIQVEIARQQAEAGGRDGQTRRVEVRSAPAVPEAPAAPGSQTTPAPTP